MVQAREGATNLRQLVMPNAKTKAPPSAPHPALDNFIIICRRLVLGTGLALPESQAGEGGAERRIKTLVDSCTYGKMI